MQFTPDQEQKLQDLNAKAHETADQMSQKAHDLANDVKDKAGQVGQKAQELAQDVKARAGEMATKASEKISEIHPQEIIHDAGELIKKHPMQALAVGAVIGGLLGALVSKGRGKRA